MNIYELNKEQKEVALQTVMREFKTRIYIFVYHPQSTQLLPGRHKVYVFYLII